MEDRVGTHFAEARRAAGLTQEQVAERLGCSVDTIGRLERGAQVPPLGRLDEAARLVGVDLADLLRERPRTRHDRAVGRVVAILRRRPVEDVEVAADLLELIFGRWPPP